MTINTKDSQAVDILRDKNENFPNIDLETIELCKNYLRVSKKALNHFWKLFNEYNISPSKYSALTALKNNSNGLMPSELAEATEITRSSMTSLVNNLIKDGLVERKAHENDRRKLKIILTEKGHSLLEDILPVVFNQMQSIFSNYSSDEMKSFTNHLDQLERNLDDVT